MSLELPGRKYGYVKVNLKPDIEALVRELSKITGFKEYTIRNLAVLLGLNELVSVIIANNTVLDFDDYSFNRLIEHVSKNVKSLTPLGVENA